MLKIASIDDRRKLGLLQKINRKLFDNKIFFVDNGKEADSLLRGQNVGFVVFNIKNPVSGDSMDRDMLSLIDDYGRLRVTVFKISLSKSFLAKILPAEKIENFLVSVFSSRPVHDTE